MKKSTILTAVLMLSLGFFAIGQDQALKRKPGFSLNAKAMTDLGVTEEQKNKIETLKNQYRVLRGKYELSSRQLDSLVIRRQDSVLTASQKQKITGLRDAIDAEKKPTPGYRKTLIPFDPKVIEELAITSEQQQKFKSIQRDFNNERRSSGEKFNKVTANAVQEQENVLTEAQKKKVAEIKAEIADYNKNIK